MEIILLENIMNLGKIGDLVKVKNGYGRNFLLKQGKALRASKENISLVNKKKTELKTAYCLDVLNDLGCICLCGRHYKHVVYVNVSW